MRGAVFLTDDNDRLARSIHRMIREWPDRTETPGPTTAMLWLMRPHTEVTTDLTFQLDPDGTIRVTVETGTAQFRSATWPIGTVPPWSAFDRMLPYRGSNLLAWEFVTIALTGREHSAEHWLPDDVRIALADGRALVALGVIPR